MASSASRANTGLLGTLFGLAVLLPWWHGVVSVSCFLPQHIVPTVLRGNADTPLRCDRATMLARLTIFSAL
jgi:hypothetical protein